MPRLCECSPFRFRGQAAIVPPNATRVRKHRGLEQQSHVRGAGFVPTPWRRQRRLLLLRTALTGATVAKHPPAPHIPTGIPSEGCALPEVCETVFLHWSRVSYLRTPA